MIELKNVKKEFNKGKVKAVKDVNLQIKDNIVYGLLGPNGAGKTTTMRMIATLIAPSAGEITINKQNNIKNKQEIRKDIAFLTNEIRLDDVLTPNELANFYGRLYGMSKTEINQSKDYLFDYFDITNFANRPYGTFSTGMKQKTSIAICMLHNPSIIIFDEPTNGLDILTQDLIEKYIIELKAKGKTVVISTHILEVVERLSDEVGVIIDGKSVYSGSMEGFIEDNSATDMRDAFLKSYRDNHDFSKDRVWSQP